MSGIERDPGELQVRQTLHAAAERDRVRRRLYADAMHPGIDLDQHSHAAAHSDRGAPHLVRGDVRIQRHGESHSLGELRQALRARPEGRIHDEQVVADFAHHLCFVRRRAREPRCAALQLLAGEQRRFVRLDVRPQRDRVRLRVVSRAIEIVIHRLEIDHECRRFQLCEVRHIKDRNISNVRLQ